MLSHNTLPRYTIFRGFEHSEIKLPLSVLITDGRLNIYDEVNGRKYFRIYSKGSDLVFQCGGYAGLIPINESVAIEVAPRVEISNLDRILKKSGSPHTLIAKIHREYGSSVEAGYLIDLLADTLLSEIDAIAEWGRHKEYRRQVIDGHPHSGRILIKNTLRLRAKNSGSIMATTARFERTVDNIFNACIKLAIERLLFLLSRTSKKSRLEVMRLSRLNVAWLTFRDTNTNYDPITIADYIERSIDSSNMSPPYMQAIPLALAILKDVGPSQRNLPPSFSLGSLIFDLADAFERYVRNCLQSNNNIVIRDGNLAPPSGAKMNLFTEPNFAAARKVTATPDVLIYLPAETSPIAVLDAKYKPYQGIPDRDDINQVVTYAAAYKTKKCGLIYPSTRASGRVENFGRIGEIDVLGISISLGAPDLEKEEQRFIHNINDALGI